MNVYLEKVAELRVSYMALVKTAMYRMPGIPPLNKIPGDVLAKVTKAVKGLVFDNNIDVRELSELTKRHFKTATPTSDQYRATIRHNYSNYSERLANAGIKGHEDDLAYKIIKGYTNDRSTKILQGLLR